MSEPAAAYDELSDADQAAARARWSADIETARAGLNLAAEFAAAGRSYVELDADDNVVRRAPTPTSRQ